jgi:hypothetical protein
MEEKMKIDEAVKEIQGKIIQMELCAERYASPQWKEDVLKTILLPTEAVRALLAGYEAAVKDVRLSKECKTCKHNSCKNNVDPCKSCIPSGRGELWEWRGPNPGGEEK